MPHRRMHEAFSLQLHATDRAEPERLPRDPEDAPRGAADRRGRVV
jgi:hypothetical protein